MKYLTAFTLFVILISACNQQQEKTTIIGPSADLGHIDIIVDSTTWKTIKNDSFMQNEFGVLETDTAYYEGKPSYDLYVLGQLNFLHFSQSKAFWADQEGSGVLVFQSQKPDMKDSLLKTWKQFFNDSLLVHTYNGADFTLEEIMAWYKTDSVKAKEPSLFANLTSYSTDAYKNWGITDSMINAGFAMKRFMESWGGKDLENKLFESITELHMTINEKEFTEIRSALLASGYAEEKNNFSHPFNPKIIITVTEEKGNPKYSKVKFKLTRDIASKNIVLSPTIKFNLNEKEGWLLLE